jgi:hypothetical protein
MRGLARLSVQINLYLDPQIFEIILRDRNFIRLFETKICICILTIRRGSAKWSKAPIFSRISCPRWEVVCSWSLPKFDIYYHLESFNKWTLTTITLNFLSQVQPVTQTQASGECRWFKNVVKREHHAWKYKIFQGSEIKAIARLFLKVGIILQHHF